MADTKTSALVELVTWESGDLFMMVDVSDTGMAATGSNKFAQGVNVFAAIPVNVGLLQGGSDDPRLDISVDSGGTGDPILRWRISGVTSYHAGIDNSASDAWVLSENLDLSSPVLSVAKATGVVSFDNGIDMDLTTADSPFVNFQATVDSDSTSAISDLTTSGATTHHVQVDINGTKAWIAVSTNVPS